MVSFLSAEELPTSQEGLPSLHVVSLLVNQSLKRHKIFQIKVVDCRLYWNLYFISCSFFQDEPLHKSGVIFDQCELKGNSPDKFQCEISSVTIDIFWRWKL